ncbi:MAG: hemolysin family protein [Ardenticatenia bacterium]|nr:hemolysin family protein [Ardenticatenia bacterium]
MPDLLVPLFVVALCIFINAFYVAAEFATVSARHARIAQLADEGNRMARLLLPIVTSPERLDTYIAACQLGITLSSLVLGFYGQATLAPLVVPWLTRLGVEPAAAAFSLATTGILLSLTTLQVILGELVPKSIGVQHPERLALMTALPMQWSVRLFQPLIWLFNGSGRLILRLLGRTPATESVHVHSPEEILVLVEELVEESDPGDVLLQEEERRLLRNMLRVQKAHIGQVMVPRTEILAAPVNTSPPELLDILVRSPYSRLLLYEGAIDKVVGFVHLKDLLCVREEQPVSTFMRPINVMLHESTPLEEALRQLQYRRAHVAIVMDEYGGVAGMITLDDLIEALFGEFRDEDDEPAPLPIHRLPGERRLRLRGNLPVEELEAALGIHLPRQGDIHTVGGLILATIKRVPRVGETVSVGSYVFRVEEMDGRRIVAVSMEVTDQQLQHLERWKAQR